MVDRSRAARAANRNKRLRGEGSSAEESEEEGEEDGFGEESEEEQSEEKVTRGRGTRGRAARGTNVHFNSRQRALPFGRSARGRGRAAANDNSLVEKYGYQGAQQSRSARAKLRNLRRGASVSEEEDDADKDHEEIERASDSNSDIRDDEIAEQLDMQEDEFSNSVIEDDQQDLGNESESEDASIRGGRRRRSAQRSSESGPYANKRATRSRQVRY